MKSKIDVVKFKEDVFEQNINIPKGGKVLSVGFHYDSHGLNVLSVTGETEVETKRIIITDGREFEAGQISFVGTFKSKRAEHTTMFVFICE